VNTQKAVSSVRFTRWRVAAKPAPHWVPPPGEIREARITIQPRALVVSARSVYEGLLARGIQHLLERDREHERRLAAKRALREQIRACDPFRFDSPRLAPLSDVAPSASASGGVWNAYVAGASTAQERLRRLLDCPKQHRKGALSDVRTLELVRQARRRRDAVTG
jgi:hypothetical protein